MFGVSRIFGSLIVICLLLVAVPAMADDDISVTVSLDRDTIGMDEQVMMQVEVSGNAKDLPDPMLPTLSMFEVYSQGRSSNFSYVNGQISSSLTYRYLLVPNKPGTFPVNQIAVVYKNKRYKANPVEITVVSEGSTVTPQLSNKASDSDGKSRDHFLEAVVDKKTCYVNEQITLSLKFYIAVRTYGSPELVEPTTTGFWTEVIGNKPPYYQMINNRKYQIIERRYALFPTQTGELSIGRATIRASVPAKGQQRRDPFSAFGDFFDRGVEISEHSREIKINVEPLPTDGRPKDFTGTIGRFDISATVNKREVEVNQPVTVTVRIRGTGNIKSVAEPTMPDLPDFRIYRASTSENVSKVDDLIGGTKVYEEVFIPKRPGQLEIPALEFDYFDPGRKRFVSTTTQPITLNVTRPEGYAASPELPYAAPDMTIGSGARDIRYIRDDIGDVTPRGELILFNPVFITINGLPVLLLAGTVVLRRRRRKLSADVGYARSRSASKVARKRLARARSLASVESTEQFYAEIYQALTSYLADKLNISPHGLTIDKMKQHLETTSAGPELTDGLESVIRSCDFARYAASSVTQDQINQTLARAGDVIASMEGVRFE